MSSLQATRRTSDETATQPQSPNAQQVAAPAPAAIGSFYVADAYTAAEQGDGFRAGYYAANPLKWIELHKSQGAAVGQIPPVPRVCDELREFWLNKKND